MLYITSNLTLLATALKKVTSYIFKDYNELNYLSLSGNYSNENFANNAFKFIQKKIIEDIKRIKPNYSFILHNGEIIENKDKSNYIVISNINGFTNFKKGLPYFALSLALIRDKQEFASVVYHPLLETLFMAEKSKGAFLNNNRLKSTYNKIENNFLTVTDNFSYLHDSLKNTKIINTECPTLELCYLSSLKVDMCAYYNAINYLDILPAIIIAREAGYKLTYIKTENKIEKLIAGNEYVRSIFNI